MKYCKLSRIVWGLVLIFFLNLVVLEFKRSDIESDIMIRTKTALKDAGIEWAWIKLSGRDAFLHVAEGRDHFDRRRAYDIVKGVYGIRVVKDVSKDIPHISPYVWSASRKHDRLKISKYVPSNNDRQTIIGIAKAVLPKLSIEDRMKIATGTKNKNKWISAINFGLQQLRYIKKGQVILTDNGLKISGRTIDADNYIAFLKNMEKKPAEVKIASVHVIPPEAKPYSWSITMIKDKVVLEGYVPDAETRTSFIQLLEILNPNLKVVDNMVYASGEPRAWSKSVNAVIRQFCKMDRGIVTLSERKVTISGTVDNQKKLDIIKVGLNTLLPKGYTLSNNIKIKKQPVQNQDPEIRAQLERLLRNF